jgi:hypothetical protein
MKQLPLTAELTALIKKAVGDDVDTTGFAVFEAIVLNTHPLPGKRGTLWEGAVATPLTLRQISDHIQNGGHVPLVSDHDLSGAPHGRVFHSDLNYAEDGSFELRALFYLDATEKQLIEKLNAGSLDEVSISFLPSQYLCSECNFDYIGAEASYSNLWDRTCPEGHVIGEDGVHVRMVGLQQLVEVSLVARGAAKNPKIVGKSASTLAPASAMRLAAKGFELDALIVSASLGEERVTFDPNKLMADLVQAKTDVATLTAAKASVDAQVVSLTADRDAANSRIAELSEQVTSLTAERDAARAAPANAEDYAVALAFLGETLNKVLVASGAEALANDKLPKTAAELKAALVDKTSALSSVLPIGGVSSTTKDEDGAKKPRLVASAFSNRVL